MIKLSVQVSNFLSPKEARPGLKNCWRLTGVKSKLPYFKIFHEGYNRVHGIHWDTKLGDFLCVGPHFQILVNENRWQISETHWIYDHRQMSIPLDHLANGTFEMPGKLSETNWGNSQRYQKHHGVHWWPTHPYRQPWEAPRCPWKHQVFGFLRCGHQSCWHQT